MLGATDIIDICNFLVVIFLDERAFRDITRPLEKDFFEGDRQIETDSYRDAP